MSELPNWVDIATPHEDIVAGTFDEALFAADLGRVSKGEGPQDYLDPVTFARKTYLTANLREALTEIGNRLAGQPTAHAVHRMQTEFGGGKTHTLLSAYHLFGDAPAVARTPIGRDLAKSIVGGRLPKANVAVLDGSDLTPDRNEKANQTPARTLLGHLAYRLGGAEAYEQVRKDDEAVRGTSVTHLVELLKPFTPCLILLDEALEFLAKTVTADHADDGKRTTTAYVFLKELTTAVASVPGACLVATLTASHQEDFAEVNHEDLLDRLVKIFGRTENVVTPVEGDDIFPVLHTRLFQRVGTAAQRSAVADAYGRYYAEQFGDVLPAEYRDPAYRQRIATAYPFHPELIDILTNRWGSLSQFQRTRGALRTLAHTVKALHRAPGTPLIHPGDLPLHDSGVKAEVLRFAGESYKSALNADIIRADSRAQLEDKRRGGEVARIGVGRGLATAAFVHSFSADRVVGASDAQMIVGVARPGLSRGTVEDVRDTIKNAAWYMRYEGGRYRFTTDPNLNKVIVERESSIPEHVLAGLLDEATGRVAPSTHPWRSVIGVRESAEIRDEPQLTLALLHPDLRVEPGDPEALNAVADRLLTRYDSTVRTNKNSSILLAADANALIRARATARTLAAMHELHDDHHRLKRFNQEQQEDLRDRIRRFEERLPALLVIAYRHLYLMANGVDGGAPHVSRHDLGPARASETITSRVTDWLRSSDGLLDRLAPAALLSQRFALIRADDQAIEIESLLHAFHRYPRLPKLASANVLRDCLVDGIRSRVFGLVSGSSWQADDAIVRFGDTVAPDEIDFQPGTWLVRATAAKALIDAHEPDPGPSPSPDDDRGAQGDDSPAPRPDPRPKSPPPAGPKSLWLRISDIPADKLRDVIKVAALQFAADGARVQVDMSVKIESTRPIAQHVIDLVVEEGLGQLGLHPEIRME